MKTFLLFVAAAILAMLPLTLSVQSSAADQPLTDFAGTWKGICQDGNPFVILTIGVSGGALAGDISIANMQGGNGQCATVTDPPTAEHAMKIDGAKVQGNTLSFQGSPKARFEMSLVDTQTARLKFLGTPVEDTPWKLVKSGDSSKQR
jgi:hypothetical protein